MKIFFGFILLLHAIIHLIGFVQAFKIAEIKQLSQNISKPLGILWLLTALILLYSVIIFFLKKESWFLTALVAIAISQILIFLFWKDAKFGTIANIIVLLVAISTNGNYQFNNLIQKESAQVLQNIQVNNLPVISVNDISHLPKIVQKWMMISGVIGKEKVVSVHLKQIGKMRTNLDSKWMNFTATQHFNLENPAFIWTTKVDALPIINIIGRDKLNNGEGEILIKLAGLIPVVNEGKNNKINQGAMVRFLAEICWFPSAAINNYISWKTIDSTLAKATLTINDKTVSGVFSFTIEGELVAFEADRYYGGKTNSKLEKWFIKMNCYKEFNGIKIPNKSNVIWKLKEGDFNWLDLEIIDLRYNLKTAFQK